MPIQPNIVKLTREKILYNLYNPNIKKQTLKIDYAYTNYSPILQSILS